MSLLQQQGSIPKAGSLKVMLPSRENLTQFQALGRAPPGARDLTRVAFSLGGGADPDGRMQRL
jgi:hypothetical protein